MANRYWVGGTAAWDATVGTKWALTSGGAGGLAIPTAADDVFLDATSGAVTVTVTGTMACRSLTCTGFTGTLAGASTPTLTVAANPVLLASGMTTDSTFPTLSFTAAGSSVGLTSAGKTIGAIVVGGGTNTVSATGTLTCGVITLTSGTFNANNNNINCTAFSSTNTNTRTLTMGNGTWTIGGVATTWWNTSSSLNLTLTSSSATVVFNPSVAGGYSIAIGNANFAPVSATILTAAHAESRITLNCGVSGTFATLTVNGPNTIIVQTALNVTNMAFNGTPDGIISIESSAATDRIVTVSGAITGKNVSVMDITKAGAGTIIFNPCWSLGHTTGVTCLPGVRKATNRVGI